MALACAPDPWGLLNTPTSPATADLSDIVSVLRSVDNQVLPFYFVMILKYMSNIFAFKVNVSQPIKATDLAGIPKNQALVDMDVQTDESSTRPKVHIYVDSDMQTEEPFNHPKPRIFKDGDVQTEVEQSRKDLDLPSKRARHESGAAASSSTRDMGAGHSSSKSSVDEITGKDSPHTKRRRHDSREAAALIDREGDVEFTPMADTAEEIHVKSTIPQKVL